MSVLTFGSLFAGIGGFDSGLDVAGMECVWQVERDKQCLSVLERHWPQVERFTDVCEFNATLPVRRPDLICGGFPCQDISVAGRRAGLAGKRSGLFYEFMRIVDEFRPSWVLIENVDGLLSSNEGRDMGAVVGTLGQLGYWWAYRVFDSQYFGLAQRRNRVFIVGHSGERTHPAEILFESDSVFRDSPPRRKAGTRVAASLTAGVAASRVRRRECNVNTVAATLNSGGNNGGFRTEPGEHLVCGTLAAHSKQHGHAMTTQQAAESGHLIAHALTSGGHDASEDGTGRGTPLVAVAYQCHGSNVGPMFTAFQANDYTTGSYRETDISGPVTTGTDASRSAPVVFAIQERAGAESETSGPGGKGYQADKAFTLEARHTTQSVANRRGVRRLMPVECERLQGFQDGWTAFGGDGKQMSDSARYRMLGNAVSVPVAQWIGRRIVELECSR